MDKATDIAKGCPVFLGGAKLSLYETFDVTAMAGGEAATSTRPADQRRRPCPWMAPL